MPIHRFNKVSNIPIAHLESPHALCDKAKVTEFDNKPEQRAWS